MNREIKFRGISLDTGIMVYGSLINYEPIPEIQEIEIGEMDYDYPSSEVKKETVGQYTGLKDKNGVEIYEGDIFHCNNVNYVLRFNQVGGAYTVHKITDEKDERFLFHCNDQIEVIGNIHENPELLTPQD